ncbi:MAG: polyphenol oxidase family protein, partial [Phycisphaerae bacterium]|nr:polyphenol oxidase family protein [Phycisphaerae bacterium]
MFNASGEFTLVRLDNGWTVGRFAALDELGFVTHVVTTRDGPDPGATPGERLTAVRQLSLAYGLNGAAFCQQVHGNSIIAVDQPGPAGSADGLITNAPSLGLLGFSADCPLILVADPVTGAIGVAHASWRGTVGTIAPRLVECMEQRFYAKARNIVACICPSAGPCCYVVGREVLAAAEAGIGRAARDFFEHSEGKLYFDLWAANVDALARAGVPPENISVASLCTICRNDLFP